MKLLNILKVKEMKLCKNCKWYKKDWLDFGSGRYSRCLNPKTLPKPKTKLSLITGKSVFIPGIIPFCAIERTYTFSQTCGPQAKFYEEFGQFTDNVGTENVR